MMRGTSWLLALVVATARGEMCGDRARVAVVGGGPGGALTAILLARQERLDVTLIEKELEVRPWDKRSYPMALNDQGAAALREAGGAAAPERIGDSRSGSAIHYPVADGWVTKPGRFSHGFGTDRSRLTAGILQQLATEGKCAIRRGAVVEGISFEEDGRVRLSLADGEEIVADAIVGADGKWSAVRRAVLDEDWPMREERRFGFNLRLPRMPDGFDTDKTHVSRPAFFEGPSTHNNVESSASRRYAIAHRWIPAQLLLSKTQGMAIYGILSPVIEGAACSIVVHEAALETRPGLAPAEKGASWEESSGDQAWAEAVTDAVVEELSPELAAELGGWPGTVRAARKATRGRRSSWVEAPEDVSYASEGGKVALIGDAAHSMTPALGLGANMALGSAVKLSEAVAAALATGGDDAAAAVHAGFLTYGASRPAEAVPGQLASAKASRELGEEMKAPRGPVRE